MPLLVPLTPIARELVAERWGRWLDECRESGGFTPTGFARVAGEKPHRDQDPRKAFSGYLSRKRYVRANTAFEIGQSLSRVPALNPKPNGLLAVVAAGHHREAAAACAILIRRATEEIRGGLSAQATKFGVAVATGNGLDAQVANLAASGLCGPDVFTKIEESMATVTFAMNFIACALVATAHLDGVSDDIIPATIRNEAWQRIAVQPLCLEDVWKERGAGSVFDPARISRLTGCSLRDAILAAWDGLASLAGGIALELPWVDEWRVRRELLTKYMLAVRSLPPTTSSAT